MYCVCNIVSTMMMIIIRSRNSLIIVMTTAFKFVITIIVSIVNEIVMVIMFHRVHILYHTYCTRSRVRGFRVSRPDMSENQTNALKEALQYPL